MIGAGVRSGLAGGTLGAVSHGIGSIRAKNDRGEPNSQTGAESGIVDDRMAVDAGLSESLDGGYGFGAEGAGSSKIPWDSWQNYEKVIKDGKTYAKVGDRLYSEHAVNRMQPSGNRFGVNIYEGLNGKDYGRSIAPQYIEDVIAATKPVYQPSSGNYVHSLGTVKVYVNPQGAVVTVTTYR